METKLLPCPSELVKRLRGRAHVEPMGTPDFWMLEDAASYIERTAQAQGDHTAAKASLLVLCAVRDGQSWSANMLKDIDFAIEANRAALNPKPEVSK
jgi:hypothetical protein